VVRVLFFVLSLYLHTALLLSRALDQHQVTCTWDGRAASDTECQEAGQALLHYLIISAVISKQGLLHIALLLS
jgi:hypothetical protein